MDGRPVYKKPSLGIHWSLTEHPPFGCNLKLSFLMFSRTTESQKRLHLTP